MAESFKYRAFISYSHRDAAWGEWLHKAVERYRVPRGLVGRQTPQGAVPARLFPLFRDREELSASTDLSTVIRAALEQASHLVVICSPRSAQSKWVNEEIIAFKRLGRADRIFAIIVDGGPNSGDPATECFPPALKFKLAGDGTLSSEPTEPVAADARESADGKDNARLKLIAGLLGVGLDELKQRDAQAQRRRLLAAYALAGVLAVLALAAVWFAISAERQRAIAEDAQRVAVTERDRAESEAQRAEQNLKNGIDAAAILITAIGQEARDAVGMQQSLLLRIQRQAEELLELLAQGQTLPKEGEMAQALAAYEMSQTLQTAGDTKAALEAVEKALQILGKLIAAHPDDPTIRRQLAAAHEQRGDVRIATGDLAGAQADYDACLSIREKLAAEEPQNPVYRRDLRLILERQGDLLVQRGDFDAGLAQFEKALVIGRELAAAFPDAQEYQYDIIQSLTRIGDVHRFRGDLDAALAAFREGLDIARKLASARPDDANVKRQVAGGHDRVARVLQAQGDLDQASGHVQEAIAIITSLAQSDPSNMTYQRDLFVALGLSGDISVQLGNLDRAKQTYLESKEIAERIAATDPVNAGYQRDLSIAHDKLGIVLLQMGDPQSALIEFEASLAISEKLAAADASNASAQEDVALSLLYVGMCHEGLGDLTRAAEVYRRSVEIAEALVAASPGNPRFQNTQQQAQQALARVEGL